MFPLYTAFQQCLVSYGEQYRKRYKLVRGKSPTIATLCLKSLEPLNAFMAGQIKEEHRGTTHTITPSYLNHLKQSLPVAHTLRVTLDHTALTLLQNLSSNMCSWRIASLACLLFEEIPATKSSLSHSMAVLYNAVSPRIAFLKDSGLHLLESSCTAVCSSVHSTSAHLQVEVMLVPSSLLSTPPHLLRTYWRLSMNAFNKVGQISAHSC